MPNTSISPLVHSPDEHNIAFMPDKMAIQKILEVQAQLKSQLGDAIWLTPPNALHCTLMEIICDTDYGGLPREEIFANWYERYGEMAKRVIASFQPFDAILDELYVSPAAIILKATDPTAFTVLRKTLLQHINLPERTKMPPGIMHCSIARYSKEIDVDSARAETSKITANIKLHIEEFKLMKDLGPDFHPSVVKTYKLGTPPIERPKLAKHVR